MKRAVVLLGLLGAALLFWSAALAGDKEAEAKALVERATAMAEKEGTTAVLRAVNDVKGPFVKGDLYLFAIALNNVALAEGSPNNKLLIGEDIGYYSFVVKMTEVAIKKGSGWVSYSWPKPGENLPSPKKSFVMRVPGKDFYIGCGYYLK